MSKNPVFEFFRQQGATRDDLVAPSRKEPFPIIGERRASELSQPPFTYRGFSIQKPTDIVENIAANPHPTNVFADSSLWAPERLDLARRLLIETPVKIIPEVLAELEDIKGQPSSPMRELLFPDGSLNSRIQVEELTAVQKHKYVMNRYVNLLHVRKKILEGPLQTYEQERGEPAKGPTRHKIMQKALRHGISQRTLRLANKGDPKRRYTDEVLSVYAVLSPILTGRDSFVLTADRDVFDQIYQFSVLLHDDYGSYLMAEDFRSNPERYPHIHPANVPYMDNSAVAVGREVEPDYLVPKFNTTCAIWVVDVRTLEVFTWVTLQEVAAALNFQERVRDGRVGDGGDGRNVHMTAAGTKCSKAPSHFLVGHDVVRSRTAQATGDLVLSEFDLFRVCVDKDIRT